MAEILPQKNPEKTTKIHDTGTFVGPGKRAQNISDFQRIFNPGPYGEPP